LGNQNSVCRPLTEKWVFTVERLKKCWEIESFSKMEMIYMKYYSSASMHVFILNFIMHWAKQVFHRS